MKDISVLYNDRFCDQEKTQKQKIWKTLCESYFQNLVSPDDHILEVACGFGEFSNHIRAQKKSAIDFNPESKKYLNPEVQFYEGSAEDLSVFKDAQFDTCFTSNFFEHLESKKAMDRVLSEIHRVLRPGGKLIAMQPNIKYSYDAYWDFYDHHLPLSHLSAAEGFSKNGFEVDLLIEKFLPFSTKSKYPKSSIFIKTYLKIPFLWRFFGKQFLIVGRKPKH